VSPATYSAVPEIAYIRRSVTQQQQQQQQGI